MMRDSTRLRYRLAMLATLPALAAGCSDSESTAKAAQNQPAAEAGAKAEAKPKREEFRASAAQQKSRKGPIINEAPEPSSPPPLDPEEARLAPIDGDPPYIDGYNPEEATCVSGNWCGTIETAMAVAPNPDAIAKEMGCPTRIVGSHDPSPIKGAAYEGLSAATAMQGSFNEHGTELARADGTDDACCYHWFEYCSGRPLMEEHGQPRVADVRPTDAWSNGHELDPTLAPRLRQALAQAWLEDALAEHASVASFARVTLELMAVGAPPELLQDAQQAGLDEIDHARRCFELAHRFSGKSQGPGPLAPVPPRSGGLARLAADTFIEGCVGETIAALMAERALSETTDPQTAQTLRVIADDEARHAALAWKTLDWALREGGSAVAQALRAAADRHRPQADRERGPCRDDMTLRPFGRLGPQQRRACSHDAWADIIDPMLARLLA